MVRERTPFCDLKELLLIPAREHFSVGDAQAASAFGVSFLIIHSVRFIFLQPNASSARVFPSESSHVRFSLRLHPHGISTEATPPRHRRNSQEEGREEDESMLASRTGEETRSAREVFGLFNSAEKGYVAAGCG